MNRYKDLQEDNKKQTVQIAQLQKELDEASHSSQKAIDEAVATASAEVATLKQKIADLQAELDTFHSLLNSFDAPSDTAVVEVVEAPKMVEVVPVVDVPEMVVEAPKVVEAISEVVVEAPKVAKVVEKKTELSFDNDDFLPPVVPKKPHKVTEEQPKKEKKSVFQW